MKIAIHQPHYFPWLGYLDKMAKVDAFILLDEVQFEKGSQMIRNRVLDINGEPKYLTMSADTNDYLNRQYKDLKVKDINIWTQKQLNMLFSYYKRADGFEEVYPLIEKFLAQEFETVCEWTCASIEFLCGLLDIKTPRIFQSQIEYDRSSSKSELVLEICKKQNADIYFSGRGGSVRYLDTEKFSDNGIKVVFQDFTHPEYTQVNAKEFVSGLSSLDMLFNCGIETTKRVFWENVSKSDEFKAQ